MSASEKERGEGESESGSPGEDGEEAGIESGSDEMIERSSERV